MKLQYIVDKLMAMAQGLKSRSEDIEDYSTGAVLEMQVRFYKAGMKGSTPIEWIEKAKRFGAEYDRLNDPDMKKYLELRQKIEGY